MGINYVSTRDESKQEITASQAILKGLADDGGLFLPVSVPKLAIPVENLPALSYCDSSKKDGV